MPYDEDKILKDQKWNEKYPKERVIMWDDTNIPFTCKPSIKLKNKLLMILCRKLCKGPIGAVSLNRSNK